MPMPTVDIDGVNLHCDIEGEGPPLLLIAGLGANASSWATIKPLLKGRFTCITFDNRGVGQSDAPPGPYTIDQMADDTAGLIRRLGYDRVMAVGWSLGGSVLQALMIRNGDLVSRAVLLSAFPNYTELQHGWLDCLLCLRQSGVAAEAQAMFGMAWGFTGKMLADHGALAAAARLGAAAPYPTSYEGFAAQAHGLRRYDSRPMLGAVKTPTLVLVGAEDVLTPVSQSIEMAELIRNARLHVLPRGGHGMAIEYPTETVAAITAFLGA
ncbi:MAG: alpha/beta hydrolase fold protein [Caulobacteraceae bacterium]|nr:alpha/beta hydrolase fold protein [Caulobacteraceae bacterium]